MEPSLHGDGPAKAGLWLAALWAVAGALAGRHGGVAAAAGIAAVALLVCIRRGRAGPELLAVTAALAALTTPARELPVLPPGPVWIAGEVTGIVTFDGAGERCTIRRGPFTVRLYVAGRAGLLPGDRIRTVARATEPALPGPRPQSLTAVADAVQVDPGPPSLPRLTAVCRGELRERILRLWPDQRGAFLCTLVLGSGPPVDPTLLAAHRATGLTHLLAVSGAHASMLALLLGVLPGLGLRHRHRIFRRTAAGILLLYGAVTGLEPPMLRALCAFAVAAWAARRGRRLCLASVLVPPAILSCAVDPEGLLGPSFALSYAAVAGLWLGAAGRRDTWTRRWILVPLRMSAWATAATAPLTLLWFGQLAPCTVLATPLLAPVVTVLLAGGLLAPLVDLCLPGATPLFCAPIGALADLYAASVVAFDLLPGTPVLAASRPAALLLAGFLVLGAAALAVLGGRRGVTALLCCLCLPHFVPQPPPTAATLHLLAVGHGQCALLRLPDGRNVVLDCGSSSHPHLAARKAVTALRRLRVDLLVLSHGDADHTSGVEFLLQRVPVAEAVLPEELLGAPLGRRLRTAGAILHAVPPGGTFRFGDVLVLARPDVPTAASNDQSLWVRLQLGTASVLLPGDAGQRGIDAALAQGLAAPAAVLVLPHHGRPEDRAADLLAAVRPRLCLVSNRAPEGSSAQGALARAAGAEVWTTGESGDLELVFSREGLQVLPELPRRLLVTR